jgi:predicted RNA-binding Zn-ribbon protein involved in translation (DUF1610 family)
MSATRQTWKFHVGTLAYVVSVPLLVWGCIKLALSGDYRILLIAFAISLSGLAFCSLTIRCPKCGALWYWLSIRPILRKPVSGWARQLLAQTECPTCGYRGDSDA